jgi:putative DNA primase/helicase
LTPPSSCDTSAPRAAPTGNPIDTILDRLERGGYDPRPAGTGKWESRCPAHKGEKRRNLSVNVGADGTVLLHCHHIDEAGQSCSVKEVVAALGIELHDLFPTVPGSRRAAPGKPKRKGPGFDSPRAAADSLARGLKVKPTAHWLYQDADGTAYAAVYRFDTPEGKTYRPVHMDAAAGHWLIGDPPGWLPYRLPELPDGEGRVWFLEGEKCADLARGLGLAATTTAHGAQSPHKTDLSALAGRDMVIVPDVGAPGEGYVAALLGLLAKLDPRPSVRVLRLPGLTADGDDIEQWIITRPGLEPAELAAELRRAADDLAVEPISATVPGPKPSTNGNHEGNGKVHEPLTDEQLGLIDMDTVQSRPVEWLWKNRIPLGKLTLLAGEKGVGKSFLTLEIASIVSRGATFPDLPTEPVTAGHVILVGAEDDLADTVKPRLDAMGADTKRITSVGIGKNPNGTPAFFSVADIPRLEAIMAARPETRLLIIDPITSYLGPINDHHNSEVRAVLMPLVDFASRYRVAIVMITHFNKGDGRKVLNRIISSVAFSATARAVWCVALDPEDENRRLYMPVVSNLSTEKTSLAYTIKDGAVAWEHSTLFLNCNEVVCQEGSSSKERRRKAVAWLQQTLAAGGMPSEEVIEKASAAGIGKNLIWEVKQEAGVMAKKKGFDEGWTWELSAASPSAADDEGSRRLPKAPNPPEGSQGSQGGNAPTANPLF